MGIKNFLDIVHNGRTFEDYTELMPADFIRGQTIVVDALNVIYSSMYALGGIHLTTGDERITTHIKIVFEKIKMLNKLGVKHMWIFDGAVNPLKEETIKKRTQRLSRDHIEEIKKLLTFCGVKWIVVSVEAEFYGAALTAAGFADCVLSSDMDVVVRGGNLLREKTINGKKHWQYINSKSFLEKTGLSLSDLARIAVHIGCDFAPKTRLIGPKKVVGYRNEPFTDRQQQAYELLVGPIDFNSSIIKKPETKLDLEGLQTWLEELGFTKVDYHPPV